MVYISPFKRDIDDLLDEDDERRRLKSQAERIFIRFGGVRRLHELFTLTGYNCNLRAMYFWTTAREKGGSGGLVPTQAWPHILKAARIDGIVLQQRDFDPRWLPDDFTKSRGWR